MTTHARHPNPTERPEFLVDGCARCAEYVRVSLALQSAFGLDPASLETWPR